MGVLLGNGARHLRELEKEDLKVVQRVVDSIKDDSEVHGWVEKIMGHRWVRVIEEEVGGSV